MAGPFCCMLLADMGADVIKVEPPGGGDQTRRAMGFAMKGEDSAASSRSTATSAASRSTSRTRRGREVLLRAGATADVLVENYRPGVAARLGVDYETLRELNPRLIYASISGFGQTGPYADGPAST